MNCKNKTKGPNKPKLRGDVDREAQSTRLWQSKAWDGNRNKHKPGHDMARRQNKK